jgi:hypothetical protein
MRWSCSAGCLVVAVLLLWLALAPNSGAADGDWMVLSGANGLKAFKGPTDEWLLAESVTLDPKNPRLLSAKPGGDILANGVKGRARDLVTKQAFGDVEVHLEFLIGKGSNSGVKLEGLYEIQIYDSHGRKELTGADCGGIYPRAELKPKYRHIDKGVPPRVNAARPAGEWQTLDIFFQPPRFDADGNKVAKARFVKVVLNGQVVHDNVEVDTPTGHAWHNKEVPTGPLLLQGDHGPVAFRDVRIRPYRGGRKDPAR